LFDFAAKMPSDYQKKKLAKKKEASKIKGGKKPTSAAQNDPDPDPSASEYGGSDTESQINGSTNGDSSKLTYEGAEEEFDLFFVC
jgi:hypothetical protein